MNTDGHKEIYLLFYNTNSLQRSSCRHQKRVEAFVSNTPTLSTFLLYPTILPFPDTSTCFSNVDLGKGLMNRSAGLSLSLILNNLTRSDSITSLMKW